MDTIVQFPQGGAVTCGLELKLRTSQSVLDGTADYAHILLG